jgi:acetyl-CoA C-acetyltransferase
VEPCAVYSPAMEPLAGPDGKVYLVAAARTPIGKFGGALSGVPAVELGATAIRAAVERSGLPADAPVAEVIMGQVLQAGAGQAPARQALLRAGLAVTVPATTVNRVCGSGLKAVMYAAAGIRAGDGEVFVAGGMESMNQAPFLLRKARFGYRLGQGALDDAAVLDGLWCAVDDCHMGTHAERVAIRAGVSREDQDALALESHRRAVAAIDAGRFDEELAPVTIRDAKGRETLVTVDEGPRRDTSAELLARLPAVFPLPEGEDRGDATRGTVTAGNAPGITDGAAATVVASERAVEQYGLQPLARIVGYAQAETTPKWLFLAPIEGVKALERRTGLAPADYDLVEVNEAFAAQVLADGRELGFDWAKVNVNGGAIALGHPIGASGARIVATLLHELRRRGGRYGLATLCLGGGGSVAMAFERV